MSFIAVSNNSKRTRTSEVNSGPLSNSVLTLISQNQPDSQIAVISVCLGSRLVVGMGDLEFR
jgi:hypothetical protein